MADPVELLTGVSITIVTPALVEIVKQLGLPVKFAGIAAVLIAMILLAFGNVANGESTTLAAVARWMIGGMVYGLAAAGLYTQTRLANTAAAAW